VVIESQKKEKKERKKKKKIFLKKWTIPIG